MGLSHTPGTARALTFTDHDGDVTAGAFSPDNLVLAVGTSAGSVVFWVTRDGHLLDRVSGRAEPIRSPAFSPGGRVAASASSHAVRTIDSETRHVLRTIDDGAILDTPAETMVNLR